MEWIRSTVTFAVLILAQFTGEPVAVADDLGRIAKDDGPGVHASFPVPPVEIPSLAPPLTLPDYDFAGPRWQKPTEDEPGTLVVVHE